MIPVTAPVMALTTATAVAPLPLPSAGVIATAGGFVLE